MTDGACYFPARMEFAATVLPAGRNYDALYRDFRWNIPAADAPSTVFAVES